MEMPEEEAFAVLVKLMQDYRMRDMFKPSMAELGLCMYQLENLVQVIMFLKEWFVIFLTILIIFILITILLCLPLGISS